MLKRTAIIAWAILLVTVSANAQLPADAVMLDKVKIAEKQKSVDLCPVTLEPSDPNLPTWEYEGVTYRGAQASAKEEFFKKPAEYAAAAAKQRFINNFMQAMSPVWCPVTDEVSPGGMTQWEHKGYIFESCCAFCDETVQDEDFPAAIERLEERAEKCYQLIGAKYTENAKSPVDGAIKRPDGASAE